MSVAEDLALRLILFRPAVVRERLDELRRSGAIAVVPNEWQIALGVLRMFHRVLFRPETVGQSAHNPVRSTLRARVLERRPFRAPLLLRERAIAPLDFSGLLSSPERVVRHLLGAHHDGNQFAYDLQMLRATPERLEETLRKARAVVAGTDPRASFLRDLCVYEGYHESLVAATERATRGEFGLTSEERSNPDVSFDAYLEWCAAQPATLEETIELVRAGRYHPMHGRAAADAVR